MEEEKAKTRADFDTDSEWYTYKVTHRSLFEEKHQDEENKNEIPPAIYQCRLCGYIINETIPPFVKLEDYKGKCPGCGCTIDAKNYRLVKPEHLKKAEEYKKEKELKKKQEKNSEKRLLTLKANSLKKKIKEKLMDIYEDLKKELELGNIDAKRFSQLLINLFYNVIKYNKSSVLDISWSEFRNLTFDMADNVLNTYNIKEELEDILADYEKDKDDMYLEYSLKIANDAKYSQEDLESMQEVEKDIAVLENQIDARKNMNDEYMKRVEKNQERLESKYELDLRKQLKSLSVKEPKAKNKK